MYEYTAAKQLLVILYRFFGLLSQTGLIVLTRSQNFAPTD